MPTRDNITVPDQYNEAATLRCEAATQVTVIVSNAPVFAQFAVEDPPGLRAADYQFLPDERRMLLASWVWDTADFNGKRIVGVRVRNAVTGTPANVTIHA